MSFCTPYILQSNTHTRNSSTYSGSGWRTPLLEPKRRSNAVCSCVQNVNMEIFRGIFTEQWLRGELFDTNSPLFFCTTCGPPVLREGSKEALANKNSVQGVLPENKKTSKKSSNKKHKCDANGSEGKSNKNKKKQSDTSAINCDGNINTTGGSALSECPTTSATNVSSSNGSSHSNNDNNSKNNKSKIGESNATKDIANDELNENASPTKSKSSSSWSRLLRFMGIIGKGKESNSVNKCNSNNTKDNVDSNYNTSKRGSCKPLQINSLFFQDEPERLEGDDEDEELPITPRTQKELFLCATCGTCYCRDHASDHHYSRGNYNDNDNNSTPFSASEKPSRCAEACARYPNHSIFIGVPTFVSTHPGHSMTASEWGLLFPTVLIKEIEENITNHNNNNNNIDMHEPLPFYKGIKTYLDNVVFETNKKVLTSTFNNSSNSNNNANSILENGYAIHPIPHHEYNNKSNSNPFNGSGYTSNNNNSEMMRNERSKSYTENSYSNGKDNSYYKYGNNTNNNSKSSSNIYMISSSSHDTDTMKSKISTYKSHDNILSANDTAGHTSSNSTISSSVQVMPSCNANYNNNSNYCDGSLHALPPPPPALHTSEESLSLPVYYANVPDNWSYMVWCAKCSTRPICLSSRTCDGELATHRHLRRLGHLLALLAYLRHRGIQLKLPAMYLNYTAYRQEVRNLRHAETQRKHMTSKDAQMVMKSTEVGTLQLTLPRSSSPTHLSANVSSSPLRVPLMSRTEIDKLITRLGICGFTNKSYFCYMNSVLQCVLRCMFFTLPLLRLEPHSRPGKLTSSVCNLLIHLRTQTYQDVLNKAANPFVQAVYGQICKIFDIFGEDQQQDAHELLITLLNGIADEFDRNKSEKEKAQMKRISFEGVIHSEVVCCGCHQVTSRDEMFMSISVPLMKSLEVGLETIFNPVHLSGKDQYACEKCFNKLSQEDQEAHNAKVRANRAAEQKLQNNNNNNTNKVKLQEASPTKSKKNYLSFKSLTKTKSAANANSTELTSTTTSGNDTITTTNVITDRATDSKKEDKEVSLSANCIYQDAVVNSSIARLGGTLVIHLLRFQYNPETKNFNKVTTPVAVPMKIDLSHYVSESVLESYGRERSLHALHRRFPALEQEELERYLQKSKWNYNTATRKLMEDGHCAIHHSRQQSSLDTTVATPRIGRHGLVLHNAVACNSSNESDTQWVGINNNSSSNNSNNSNNMDHSERVNNEEYELEHHRQHQDNVLMSSSAGNSASGSFHENSARYTAASASASASTTTTTTDVDGKADVAKGTHDADSHTTHQSQPVTFQPYIFKAAEMPLLYSPNMETNPIANASNSASNLNYSNTSSATSAGHAANDHHTNNNNINYKNNENYNGNNCNSSSQNSNVTKSNHTDASANSLSPFIHARSSSSLYLNFVNRTGESALRADDDSDPYNARYSHIPSLTRQLVGFITHRGSLDSGHYIAYIRYLSKPDMWFRCDDEDIDLVDERYISDVSADAYLAFYEERNNA